MMQIATKKRTSMRLNACPRCGGSAYLESAEENEWRCLQCARTIPPPSPEELEFVQRAVA
jgi:tRNA(Ile2) C34 agmatinyltransferase TiaS